MKVIGIIISSIFILLTMLFLLIYAFYDKNPDMNIQDFMVMLLFIYAFFSSIIHSNDFYSWYKKHLKE